MSRNTMQFVCNEDIDQMPKTECGRYCAVCQREVIDFRNVPKKQLESLRGKNVCGIFLPEQVEEGITPIQLPKVRFIAATFLTFLGLEVSAQQELGRTQPAPTELVADDTTLVADTPKTQENFPPEDAMTKKEIRHALKYSYTHKKPFMHIGRTNYYWSRRFPFIKIVRRRIFVGKF